MKGSCKTPLPTCKLIEMIANIVGLVIVSSILIVYEFHVTWNREGRLLQLEQKILPQNPHQKYPTHTVTEL